MLLCFTFSLDWFLSWGKHSFAIGYHWHCDFREKLSHLIVSLSFIYHEPKETLPALDVVYLRLCHNASEVTHYILTNLFNPTSSKIDGKDQSLQKIRDYLSHDVLSVQTHEVQACKRWNIFIKETIEVLFKEIQFFFKGKLIHELTCIIT